MHSLTDEFLDAIRFDSDQASTLKAVGEYRGKQTLFERQVPEVLESLKQTAIIESTTSSNRLEGITAPDKRIREIVLKPTAARNRSEQEIAGYRDALAFIHEAAGHMPFTVNTILQLHGIMYRYLAADSGKWKPADNRIVERHADGTERVRFTPVSAVETPQAMEDLVDRYRAVVEHDGREPMVVVPLAVFDFLCIHPFADGNGRMARLLTLMLLYHFGYEVGRFISLERVFEESKETYYEALKASSANWHQGRHDPYPWINYFWGALLRAYREFEERVGTIRSTSRGTKGEQVREAVQRRIMPFAISDLERDCPNVSRDMIRKVLRELRDEGVIVPQGSGRGARWIRRQE